MTKAQSNLFSLIRGLVVSLILLAMGFSIWQEEHSNRGKWLMAFGCATLILDFTNFYRSKRVG